MPASTRLTLPSLFTSGFLERKQLVWLLLTLTEHVAPSMYGLAGMARMKRGLELEFEMKEMVNVLVKMAAPVVAFVTVIVIVPEIELWPVEITLPDSVAVIPSKFVVRPIIVLLALLTVTLTLVHSVHGLYDSAITQTRTW